MTTPIPMKGCPGDESLQAFLDGGLEPALRSVVAAHAANCARCAGALDGYRRLDAALRGFEPGEPGPGFTEATVRLATARPRSVAVVAAAAIAAIAAVIVVASRFVALPEGAILSAAPRFEAVASLDFDPRALGASAASGFAAHLGAVRLPAEPAAGQLAVAALAAASLNGLAIWLAGRRRGSEGRPS